MQLGSLAKKAYADVIQKNEDGANYADLDFSVIFEWIHKFNSTNHSN